MCNLIASALHLISVEQVMFTGSPDFDDEGREHVPDEPVRYVGKPTDEVDAAWDKLTEGMFSSQFLFGLFASEGCQLESVY